MMRERRLIFVLGTALRSERLTRARTVSRERRPPAYPTPVIAST